MRISLNVDKSIQQDWVVNDRQDSGTKWNKYFNIFFRLVFVGLILLGLPIFLWIGIYTDKIASFSTLVFPGIIFTFGLIGLYGSLLGDKFIRFRGEHDLDRNREAVLHVLKEYYPKNTFYNGGNFLTSYLVPTGFMKDKRSTNRILVLFDRNDVLINIAVFNGNEIQSPFHAIFHHLLINRIKNKLADAKFNIDML